MNVAVRLLAGASILACGQCASSPSLRRVDTIRPGDRVVVTFRSGSTTLALRNASSLAPEKAYSTRGGDLNLKIAHDTAMQALLDSLATLGFYDRAQPAALPGAKATLTLEHGDKRLVLSRLPVALGSAEEALRFTDCMAVFRAVYDATTAYHTGVGVDPEDLYEANRRLREDARRRLERSRSRWQPR